MNSLNNRPETKHLERWLAGALSGLPEDKVEIIRLELIEHYREAFDYYVNQGLGHQAAGRRAVADLGDAGLVNRGFKDAYFGRRRYRLAWAAAAALLLVYLTFPMLAELLPVSAESPIELLMLLRYDILLPVVYDLLLFGLSFTVLSVTEQLLRWRFGFEQRPAFRLAKGGLALQVVADVAMLLLFGASLNVGADLVRWPTDAGLSLELGLIVAAVGGFFALGIGLLGLGRALWCWPEALYGLRRPLAGAMLLMGAGMATMGLWLSLGNENLLLLDAVMVIIAHMLMWPLMILLYFRVLYRRPLDAGYA